MGRVPGVKVELLFCIFLTPVFYFVVRWFSDPGPVKPALAHGPDAALAGTEKNG